MYSLAELGKTTLGINVVGKHEHPDVQNRRRIEIEDALFEWKDHHAVSLTFEHIDQILEYVIDIARVRRP
jgi:hypothetical protein